MGVWECVVVVRSGTLIRVTDQRKHRTQCHSASPVATDTVLYFSSVKMSPKVIFGFAMLATLLACNKAAPPEKACTEYEKPCKTHGECCGGCCQQDKCAPYSESCVSASNPCHLYDCPPNKECYLLQVQCLQSPCKPIPACRAKDAEDYD